ncbi:MAG: ParB/RepB/Spo0J family partition protein [Bdellovibrionota bacterium]
MEDQANKENPKIKTRTGSGYLKQLYSTARTTAGVTHSHLKNLTTFLVNFVPIEKVDASELQVRVHFDEAELTALSASVKEHGVLQPILVVQDGERYKVIAGERRLRAAKLAGMERIPARVLSTTDKATHEIALRENLDRVDLHPLEEGEGYLSLLEAQAYTSHEAISKAFGKPKSRITECIGFTKLPENTKQELMVRGIKNRALLRNLLNTPPDTHMTLIAEALGKEETLNAPTPELHGDIAKNKSDYTESKKEKAFQFSYVCEEKKIHVPAFRWKPGEGAERLQSYVEALRALLDNLEERLTKP